MVYREIITQAKRLPRGEQLQLIDELLHSMRQSARRTSRKNEEAVIPFIKLRGALKSESDTSSDVLREDYTQYLVEKYL